MQRLLYNISIRQLFFPLLVAFIASGCAGNQNVRVELLKNSDKLIVREFYPNGNLKSEAVVENDTLVGEVKVYYEKGSIANSSTYDKGIRVGVNLIYYENGFLKIKENYNSQGKLDEDVFEYFENGELKLKGQYKSGNKSGTWKDYYQDGRLFEENTYRDNEYNGFQKVFHPNGNLAVLGEAINGKEEGDWLILDLDGDTLKIEKYKAGEIIHVKQFKESEKANYSNNY